MDNIVEHDWNHINSGIRVKMNCFTVECEDVDFIGTLDEEKERDRDFFGKGKYWFKPETEIKVFELAGGFCCLTCREEFNCAVAVYYKKVVKGKERIIVFGHSRPFIKNENNKKV